MPKFGVALNRPPLWRAIDKVTVTAPIRLSGSAPRDAP
jgi:hypothetical protein